MAGSLSAGSIQATAFGVAFDVEVDLDCPEVACRVDDLDAALPPGWSPRPGPANPARFSLHADGPRAAVTGPGIDQRFDWDQAAHGLDAAIRSLVALDSPDFVFVHAGVVATEAGAIVLPGRSFAGKSTLVAALLQAGAAYLSDEYAVLDADGLTHPYPRRLSIRQPAGARREVDARDEIGAPVADGPVPVVGIATLTYREGADWSVGDGDARLAALALVDNAVAARTRPAAVLAACAIATRGAWYLDGERGDAMAAARRLLART